MHPVQAELSLHEHSSKKTVVLSARKAGFIKVAMETGSKLVPMVLFGESQLLDNPFDLPTAQVYHIQCRCLQRRTAVD